MKYTTARMLSVSLTAMLILSVMTVLPVVAGTRTFPGPGAGAATFYVTPALTSYTSPPLKTGTTFTVEVRIAQATNVASWQVELSYNAAYLSTTVPSVTYAPDMIFPGGTYSPTPAAIGVENATHNYILMTAATFGGVEYATADAGLIRIVFTIILDPPASTTLMTSLYLERPGKFGCFAADTNVADVGLLTLTDGYYEIEGLAPPKASLEISPAVTNMPAIDGDRIVGTPDSFFDVSILIHNVDPVDELFFVQLNLTWDPALVDLYWIYEGTFMNNPTWSPFGTLDNSTIKDPGGLATYWIMILPDPNTGIWTNTVWPSGDGLLATARFRVIAQNPDADGVAPAGLTGTSPIDLSGVFDQYFIGHPNSVDPPYLPFEPEIDGVVNVYDYYWKAPVAIKTHTPDTPLVDEIVTFDGSGSYGYRNVDGAMVADPAYIVSWAWDFGDTFFGSGPIVTHAYTAMGIYTVTLTVTDLDGRTGTVSQEVEVIFGRLIDVYVGPGTGAYPAPYGGQGQDKVADMFEPQKTVCVYANVTYNGDAVQSKLVTFIIISPHNLHDFSRSAITNSYGTAYIEFGLPWPCVDPVNEIFGIWNITVKVDIRSTVVEDTVAFKVWWPIEVTSVVPKAAEFIKGGYACFDITFRTYRMQPIDGVLEITLYDDLDVPFGAARIELQGIGWGNYTWCMFKEYHVEICVFVPKWAFVGTGKAYVNFFHYDPTNPYNMGNPYCPEAFCTFKILKPVI